MSKEPGGETPARLFRYLPLFRWSIAAFRPLCIAVAIVLAVWILAPALLAEEAEPAAPAPSVEAPSEATVMYMNRSIVTLRVSIAGMSPEERADRIHRRLVELDELDASAADYPRASDDWRHKRGVRFARRRHHAYGHCRWRCRSGIEPDRRAIGRTGQGEPGGGICGAPRAAAAAGSAAGHCPVRGRRIAGARTHLARLAPPRARARVVRFADCQADQDDIG